MTEHERHTRYEETRRRFDDLDVEEQATFLVEATASILARGLEQAGTALAGGIEELVQQVRNQSETTTGSSRRPGAAEPETAQRQRPRWGQSAEDEE